MQIYGAVLLVRFRRLVGRAASCRQLLAVDVVPRRSRLFAPTVDVAFLGVIQEIYGGRLDAGANRKPVRSI